MDDQYERRRPGETARAKGRRQTLNSRRIAALPILEHFLRRLRLREFLCDHLPHEDRRSRVPTATALLILLKNLLISREPLYGLGEWAARHEPDLLGLEDNQWSALNDDRIGRSLDRLFDADIPALTLNVAAHAVREFDVSLDELHNDSTTITFHVATPPTTAHTRKPGNCSASSLAAATSSTSPTVNSPRPRTWPTYISAVAGF
jgi:Domain of unknown function (DUF4277)